MNLQKIACAAGLSMLMTGCLVAPFQPPQGTVYSKYAAPLSTEGNLKQGTKRGSTEVVTVLGLVSTGDCSLKKAMDNGGIKEAYYADYEYFNVLGVYQKTTLNVTGE